MKLRNKKTEEIGFTAILRSKDIVVMDENAIQLGSYSSLAELNKEWEDYEKPKDYWYIDGFGDVVRAIYQTDDFNRSLNAIGNHFETPEEAELAVRKLEAWKRLKDKGLKFERWGIGGEYGNTITFSDYIEYNDETRADLDLLFGGEDD